MAAWHVMPLRPLVFVVALIAVLAACAPAWAHAALLASDPGDGAVVPSAPAMLTLRFDEPVAPVSLRLVEPDGAGVMLTFRLDGAQVLMPMPAGVGNGTYALSWRVISADGHPVGGTTTFSIGAPSSARLAAAAADVDWPVRIGIWTGRLLTYAGLFFGAGGVFFCRWLGSSRGGLVASRTAAILGLVAMPVNVAFQGLDALGLPASHVLAGEAWREGLAGSFGVFVALASIALALALLATLKVRATRLFAALAFVGVPAALASTGHASSADPQWLTRSAVFIHTAVVAFWIGALLPLALLLRQPAKVAVRPMQRFATAMPLLLVLLIGAGIALAVVQIKTPDALLSTDYGRVFVAKLMVVAVLLGLAAINRYRLTASALADDEAAKRRLGRAILIEAGAAVLLFGIVALWRFTPPPRALIEAAAVPALVHIHTGEGMAEVTVSPGHAGPVDASIFVASSDFGPLPAQGLTLSFANKAKGIEPIERQAKLGDDGNWHIDHLTLPTGGTWQVGVDILVSDFKEIDLTGDIDIRP